MSNTLQTVEALVKHWVTFIEGHVKMVLTVGSILLVLHLGSMGINAWDSHTKRQLDITQQQIKTSDQSTKDLEAQIADLKLQTATALAQNQALRSKLDSQLKDRRKVDDSLPLVDIASRMQDLINLGPGQVIAPGNDTVVMTSPAAHKVTDDLESIPVLTQQRDSFQSDLVACTTLSGKKDLDIANLHTDVALRDKEIGQLNGQITQARHDGEKRGFKWGAIVSTAVMIAIKIAKF